MDHCKELRIKQDVVPRNREKRKREVQYAVHGFFRDQDPQRSINGYERQDEEKIFRKHHIVYALNIV
jgi:hypothetical protein